MGNRSFVITACQRDTNIRAESALLAVYVHHCNCKAICSDRYVSSGAYSHPRSSSVDDRNHELANTSNVHRVVGEVVLSDCGIILTGKCAYTETNELPCQHPNSTTTSNP